MLSDTDYELLMQRIKKLEERIDVLDAYVQTQLREKYYPKNSINLWQSVRTLPKTKCLWESIPLADRNKPTGLSCPCEKCSPHC